MPSSPRVSVDPSVLLAPDLLNPRSIFDMLNFRVAEFYGVSGSLVTRLCEGEFGITREEWQFMAMLAALGALSPSDLAARTTVDRSQGSRTVQGLVAKGLAYRAGVAGDGRRRTVGLTERGQALYAQVFPRVVAVHHAVLSGLDDTEVAVLARCLWKMQLTALDAARSGLVGATADRRHGGSRRRWEG